MVIALKSFYTLKFIFRDLSIMPILFPFLLILYFLAYNACSCYFIKSTQFLMVKFGETKIPQNWNFHYYAMVIMRRHITDSLLSSIFQTYDKETQRNHLIGRPCCSALGMSLVP